MPDTPAPPKGDDKSPKNKKGKGGLLTGKNKWYVVGGLGLLAVLVFFFVSRSNSNAGATTTTGGTGLDPSTQAALQGALQGQGASGGFPGIAGDTGPAGPRGATGKRGKQGKPGKPGKRTLMHPPHTPPHKRAGHTTFYTVRPGDTLSKIAAQHNVSGGWSALYHHNRGVVGSNPNAIHPGQRLRI